MNERPAETDYAGFYKGYVSLVPEADVVAVLADQASEIRRRAGAVAAAHETHRYGPEKWSIREVFGHLVDAERVFGYRAFCIGRGEQVALPGFDEKAYVAASGSDKRPLAELAAEFVAVRESNLAALRRLDDADWRRAGNANGASVTVRALAFIMAGHVRHHLGVLASRYGAA